jgi:hypothetical protein
MCQRSGSRFRPYTHAFGLRLRNRGFAVRLKLNYGLYLACGMTNNIKPTGNAAQAVFSIAKYYLKLSSSYTEFEAHHTATLTLQQCCNRGNQLSCTIIWTVQLIQLVRPISNAVNFEWCVNKTNFLSVKIFRRCYEG